MSIYKKLLEIQKYITGLSKNKNTYNYSYVTGDKILGFIRPKMDDLGLILKQEVILIENTRQDYQLVDKQNNIKHKSEILSKVMMRFTWIDTETGEKDVNEFGANGQNDWEKGLGSALTYAERYFLLKYFHIATDADDVDNDKRKTTAPVAMPKKEDLTFEQAVAKLNSSTDLDMLKSNFLTLKPEMQKATEKVKNEIKEKLSNNK